MALLPEEYCHTFKYMVIRFLCLRRQPASVLYPKSDHLCWHSVPSWATLTRQCTGI
jgi:hypothetical protein